MGGGSPRDQDPWMEERDGGGGSPSVLPLTDLTRFDQQVALSDIGIGARELP